MSVPRGARRRSVPVRSVVAWAAGGLCAGLALILGLRLLEPGGVERPHARVYVLVERSANGGPGLDERTIRTGDVLHVSVTGTPGVYTSLLNLDSDHRFQLVGRRWDEAIESDPVPIARALEADDATGREQLVVVAAHRPVGPLDELLGELNETRGLSRAERVERLGDRLDTLFGRGTCAVYASQELRHRE